MLIALNIFSFCISDNQSTKILGMSKKTAIVTGATTVGCGTAVAGYYLLTNTSSNSSNSSSL